MEVIIGLIVIFILLLCMGASLGFIASIALALVGAFVVFMAGFFIYATIKLLSGKRAKGIYVRSETIDKSKIPYAVYVVDGVEYKNMLPLEVLFQKKIYQENKEVLLILNVKKRRCFDTNAVICCILGIIVSMFLIVEMIILLTGNNIL